MVDSDREFSFLKCYSVIFAKLKDGNGQAIFIEQQS